MMIDSADGKILYAALLGHDGGTLRPDWDTASQDALTDVLDRIRKRLFRDRVEEFNAMDRST